MAACHRPENGDTVVTWPGAVDQIERDPEGGSDEPGPLQNADRAWQIAKPKLIGKGNDENRVDRHKPKRVEQLRQVRGHSKRSRYRPIFSTSFA